VFQVHGDGVRSATYSSNGREILTASLDKTAVIWDARLAADAKTQLNWLKAALFDPLTALEISQLGLVTNSSADGTNSSFVAKFLSAARLKLKNAFRLKSSKPTGADNALHDSDPQSLVKKAAQDELAAVASPNSNKSTDLLLAAFNEYCAALRLQPDGKDSAYWRFRRATLARRFARLGALDQIAKAFDRE
jgi:WD40 repeat protein